MEKGYEGKKQARAPLASSAGFSPSFHDNETSRTHEYSSSTKKALTKDQRTLQIRERSHIINF